MLVFGNDPSMNAKSDSALEHLTRFVQVIGRDAALRKRFWQIAKLSPAQRFNEIYILAEQMTAERKDPALVAVFRLFADARVFEAAMIALRQCGYGEEV